MRLRLRRKYRLPLLLLGLLLALPFLLKGLMYLRVKQAVDDLAAQLTDQATLSYAGIETELKGAASVVGVEIYPAGFERPVSIERVHLATGDPWAFVAPAEWLRGEQARIPEQMHITLQAVRIPLQGGVYRIYRERLDAQRLLGREPAAACASFNLDPVQLRDMGFDALMLDLGMDYHFRLPAERLDVSLDFVLRDIESVSLSMRLAGLLPEDLQAGQVAGAKYAQADLRVRVEPAFGKRFVAHCASQQKLSLEAYQESLVMGFRENLRHAGVTLGKDLQQALEDYYRQWGQIRVYSKPGEPIGLMRLLGLSPEQLLPTLGISLFINEKPISDLDIDIDIARLAKGADKEHPVDKAGKADTPRRVRIVREFLPASPGTLDLYLGETVRIRPKGQPAREGVLTAIVGGKAQVQLRTHGGSVTSQIPLNQIESVEVEQRQKVPIN